ncbi:MAG: Holliday junction resolvase RuvX [Oscillospiraceae bacterium]|jgi:putative Holliday junction resolvase|nr:Holliday junction resolvase RuvX [Oscillospiraceae bacterium]
MRIMAIDYGDARTGIAVSDASGTLTGDAWVIHSKSEKETARIIIEEATKRGVSCIVVGYPKNMNGTIGPRAKKSEHLAKLLEKQGDGSSAFLNEKAEEPSPCFFKVELWDERMTTISAKRILDDVGKYGKKRKKTIDAVAASMILEGYLGHQRR